MNTKYPKYYIPIIDWDKLIEEPPKIKPIMPKSIQFRKRYKRNPAFWIKKTEKCTRYKIFNIFKYNPSLQKRIPFGKLLYVYEHSDKLVFVQLDYNIVDNKHRNYTTTTVGVLKHKNDKFNFYLKHNNKWRNRSNYWSPIAASFNCSKIKFAHLKRIKSILKRFAQKFHRKYEVDLTPISISSGIIRLCYPVLNKLAPKTETIAHINKEYCRYLRGKDDSKFVKSLKIRENKYPRFFKLIYSTSRDPAFLRIMELKYIKYEKDGKITLVDKNNKKCQPFLSWTIKDCDENVKNGKFKEIPHCEAVLME